MRPQPCVPTTGTCARSAAVAHAVGTHLDLFSNPGVILEPSTYGGTIFPAALIFAATVPLAGGTSVTDTMVL